MLLYIIIILYTCNSPRVRVSRPTSIYTCDDRSLVQPFDGERRTREYRLSPFYARAASRSWPRTPLTCRNLSLPLAPAVCGHSLAAFRVHARCSGVVWWPVHAPATPRSTKTRADYYTPEYAQHAHIYKSARGSAYLLCDVQTPGTVSAANVARRAVRVRARSDRGDGRNRGGPAVGAELRFRRRKLNALVATVTVQLVQIIVGIELAVVLFTVALRPERHGRRRGAVCGRAQPPPSTHGPKIRANRFRKSTL